MALSPEEIENKHFLVALRGYDKDEVTSFLRMVAADYRELLQATELTANNALGQSRTSLDSFDELGDRVASIVRSAVEVAEDLREGAEREAAVLLAAAHEEISRLRATAAEETAALVHSAKREAAALLAHAEQEAASLRAAAAEHTTALSVTGKQEAADVVAAARDEGAKPPPAVYEEEGSPWSGASSEERAFGDTAKREAAALLAEVEERAARIGQPAGGEVGERIPSDGRAEWAIPFAEVAERESGRPDAADV